MHEEHCSVLHLNHSRGWSSHGGHALKEEQSEEESGGKKAGIDPLTDGKFLMNVYCGGIMEWLNLKKKGKYIQKKTK